MKERITSSRPREAKKSFQSSREKRGEERKNAKIYCRKRPERTNECEEKAMKRRKKV
jgi:hypothetical protein